MKQRTLHIWIYFRNNCLCLRFNCDFHFFLIYSSLNHSYIRVAYGGLRFIVWQIRDFFPNFLIWPLTILKTSSKYETKFLVS